MKRSAAHAQRSVKSVEGAAPAVAYRLVAAPLAVALCLGGSNAAFALDYGDGASNLQVVEDPSPTDGTETTDGEPSESGPVGTADDDDDGDPPVVEDPAQPDGLETTGGGNDTVEPEGTTGEAGGDPGGHPLIDPESMPDPETDGSNDRAGVVVDGETGETGAAGVGKIAALSTLLGDGAGGGDPLRGLPLAAADSGAVAGEMTVPQYTDMTDCSTGGPVATALQTAINAYSAAYLFTNWTDDTCEYDPATGLITVELTGGEDDLVFQATPALTATEPGTVTYSIDLVSYDGSALTLEEMGPGPMLLDLTVLPAVPNTPAISFSSANPSAGTSVSAAATACPSGDPPSAYLWSDGTTEPSFTVPPTAAVGDVISVTVTCPQAPGYSEASATATLTVSPAPPPPPPPPPAEPAAPPPANIVTTNTPSQKSGAPGSKVTGTVTVTNKGDGAATNLHVTGLTSPARGLTVTGATITASSGAAGSTGCDLTGQPHCWADTLEPGGWMKIHVEAELAAGLRACSWVAHTATARAENDVFTEWENSATARVQIAECNRARLMDTGGQPPSSFLMLAIITTATGITARRRPRKRPH